MMRENQIFTTAVNIKGFTKVLLAHYGTFDVPARPTGSPGTLPSRFICLTGLPKSKIHGIVLMFIDINTGTGHHIFQPATGKLAITGKAIYGEINVSFNDICQPTVLKLPDQFNHPFYMFRCAGSNGRSQNSQACHVLVMRRNVAISYIIDAHSFSIGPGNDFIIYIGKVLYINDLITTVLQVSSEDVKNNG
ncbi:MAG: hypothetical protein A4E66_02249 [Syntrophus sp. PtaB.Bin001]|nr:MAG: hypothetical protein A4E66_02249 [Syntrophus sp. PtaB.Bin001]